MKLARLIILMIALVMIVAGCSDKEEEPTPVEPNETELEKEVEEEEHEEVNEAEEDAVVASVNGEIDFATIVKQLEETTDGTATLLFENLTAHEHDMEGVKITLDGYQLLELNDFHTNYEIPFDYSTDGGVFLAHYTVENTLDEQVHYAPTFEVTYPGAVFKSHYRDLIPLEVQIHTKLSPDNNYELPAGEVVSGYVITALTPEMFEDIQGLGEVELRINQAASDYDAENYEYNPPIGKESKFNVSVSEAGESIIAERGKFYDDSITTQNMGTKTLIKEKRDINESDELSKSKITLEGYQFTEYEPNDYEAPRFGNFTEGIVVLTINFEIENKESQEISLYDLGNAKLDFNDGKVWTLSEEMLTDYKYGDVLEAGETGNRVFVFLFEKDEYDLIYKDKSFEMRFGPLKSGDGEDLSKGKELFFELPQ